MKNNKIETPERITYLDSRYYTIDGQEHKPSVTEIISKCIPSPGLNFWKETTDKQEREKAIEAGTTRGTNVHEGIEQLLADKEIWFEGFTYEEWDMISKAADIIKKYGVIPLYVELVLYDKKADWAGTADLIAQVGDETWLMDWKTNNAPDEKKWQCQMAAYKFLCELNGIHIDKACMVHVNSKVRTDREHQGPGWKLYFLENYEYWLGIMRVASNLYFEFITNQKPLRRRDLVIEKRITI